MNAGTACLIPTFFAGNLRYNRCAEKETLCRRTCCPETKERMILMIEWTHLRENPHIRRIGTLLLCALTACLLSLARFGGLQLPLNAALAAALSPAGGIAVLAGSASADFLTGNLQKQPLLLCATALVTIIRWLLNVKQTPRAAALLAGCSTCAAAVIFAIARLTNSREWVLWLIFSLAAAGLAYCIRQVILRFGTDLPVRLHAGDTLAFSVCYVTGLTALCSLRLMQISFGVMLAAAVILTADELITEWFFGGDSLTAKDMSEFLKSAEAVSSEIRGYEYMCGWVAANHNRFGAVENGECYGEIEETGSNAVVYIIRSVFDRACGEAGINPKALLAYLRHKNLIKTRGDAKGYCVNRRMFPGMPVTQCVDGKE